MENANKDEADRCLEIAEKALKAGDVEKARRLTKKSLQLCATQRAEGELGETPVACVLGRMCLINSQGKTTYM